MRMLAFQTLHLKETKTQVSLGCWLNPKRHSRSCYNASVGNVKMLATLEKPLAMHNFGNAAAAHNRQAANLAQQAFCNSLAPCSVQEHGWITSRIFEVARGKRQGEKGLDLSCSALPDIQRPDHSLQRSPLRFENQGCS